MAAEVGSNGAWHGRDDYKFAEMIGQKPYCHLIWSDNPYTALER